MAIHTLEFYVVAIHTLTPLYRGPERVDCCRTYQTKNPSVYIAAEQRRVPAARTRRHAPSTRNGAARATPSCSLVPPGGFENDTRGEIGDAGVGGPNPPACPLNQKRRRTRDAVMFPGAPGRIRTVDTRFRRAVLYPLSYGGK